MAVFDQTANGGALHFEGRAEFLSFHRLWQVELISAVPDRSVIELLLLICTKVYTLSCKVVSRLAETTNENGMNYGNWAPSMRVAPENFLCILLPA